MTTVYKPMQDSHVRNAVFSFVSHSLIRMTGINPISTAMKE